MSKLVWLCLMLEFIAELTLVVAGQPSRIRRFNITVERNCQYKRDSILAPSSARALLKNLTCRTTYNGGRRTQCFCKEEETFIAQNRTCVKNGFLVQKNNCKQVTFHRVKCDKPKDEINIQYITGNIMMMDDLTRDISIRGKYCRPSTTVISKHLNCRGVWENVSFPIAYQLHIEKNFIEWFRTVTVDKKGVIKGNDQFRRGLRGRLIKLALECKDWRKDKIHQECVLLKAKGSQTCHFQVTHTVVTVTPLKSSTAHHLHDLDAKKSTPVMRSSEVYTTFINLPTMRSRSEKESGNSNCDIKIAILVSVVVGVCSLVIVVICFVFRKLIRNKKEVKDRPIELEEHHQGPKGLRRSTEVEEQYQGLNRSIILEEQYQGLNWSTELEEQYQDLNWSTKLEEQYQSLRNSTSIMEQDGAVSDMLQNSDPIFSKSDKHDKRYKTKPEQDTH